MSPLKRTAAAAASAAILIGSLGGPATALAASSHWSKAQCKAYVTSFHRKHAHATSAQKTGADRTLRSKGCAQKV